MLLLAVVPHHSKNLRSLRGGSSSILYHKVRALPLFLSAKYTLEKNVISLSRNDSVMEPSTLSLLLKIALRYFNALSV
jgi:hypothetical protein